MYHLHYSVSGYHNNELRAVTSCMDASYSVGYVKEQTFVSLSLFCSVSTDSTLM
jgi:hypothetical protein